MGWAERGLAHFGGNDSAKSRPGVDPAPKVGGALDPLGGDRDKAPHRPAGEFHRTDVLLGLRRLGIGAIEADHQVLTDDSAGHVAVHHPCDTAEILRSLTPGLASATSRIRSASSSE
jgi:hypothetical protein